MVGVLFPLCTPPSVPGLMFLSSSFHSLQRWSPSWRSGMAGVPVPLAISCAFVQSAVFLWPFCSIINAWWRQNGRAARSVYHWHMSPPAPGTLSRSPPPRIPLQSSAVTVWNLLSLRKQYCDLGCSFAAVQGRGLWWPGSVVRCSEARRMAVLGSVLWQSCPSPPHPHQLACCDTLPSEILIW